MSGVPISFCGWLKVRLSEPWPGRCAVASILCGFGENVMKSKAWADSKLVIRVGRLRRRAECHGFEYFRHGTLSLYAALNTQTGEVLGKTAGKHTSAEFVAFLTELASGQPKRRKIHVIVDNLSAHKTEKVELFLQEHPQVKLHFTPTYASWLNQVELWFSKIERDVIARGVFCSVKDLAKKLMRYIRQYNRQAKPVKWTYKNT